MQGHRGASQVNRYFSAFPVVAVGVASHYSHANSVADEAVCGSGGRGGQTSDIGEGRRASSMARVSMYWRNRAILPSRTVQIWA